MHHPGTNNKVYKKINKNFEWSKDNFNKITALNPNLIIANKEENTNDIPNKIMPLGASRVQGFSPWFESYRYELWKDLIDGGWEFDYIGTETEIGSYPNYEGMSFDPDHQGCGGWTSGQILNSLESALLETGVPDIILFSSPGGISSPKPSTW